MNSTRHLLRLLRLRSGQPRAGGRASPLGHNATCYGPRPWGNCFTGNNEMRREIRLLELRMDKKMLNLRADLFSKFEQVHQAVKDGKKDYLHWQDLVTEKLKVSGMHTEAAQAKGTLLFLGATAAACSGISSFIKLFGVSKKDTGSSGARGPELMGLNSA